MSEAVIRKVKEGDLQEICEIEGTSFADEAYPPSYMKLLSLLYEETFLVAEVKGKVMGYVVSRLERKNVGHIISIAVRPEYRRCGIATFLITKLLHVLKRAGVSSVRLEVRESNIAARRLYEKLGFKVTGRINSYYRDGEDAILMSKTIE